jgi:hypothetical protein
MLLRKTHCLAICLVAAVALAATPARSQAGITVIAPSGGSNINGQMFVPSGSYSANDVPTTATMTDATGKVFTATVVFANPPGGGGNGFWYAAFPTLPSGTYTLDVSGGNAVKSVGGLIVP